jgi:hypothetical protein
MDGKGVEVGVEIGVESVDAAHAVDRDLLHQQLLFERLVVIDIALHLAIDERSLHIEHRHLLAQPRQSIEARAWYRIGSPVLHAQRRARGAEEVLE